MKDGTIIFGAETETPEGPSRLCVAQREAGRFVVGLEVGETTVGAALSADQALAMALEILAASDCDALRALAEQIPEQVAAELGMALLAGPAAVALRRQAAADGTTPEAS